MSFIVERMLSMKEENQGTVNDRGGCVIISCFVLENGEMPNFIDKTQDAVIDETPENIIDETLDNINKNIGENCHPDSGQHH